MNLLIDNYDSFTHILADYLEQIEPGNLEIIRNDEKSLASIVASNPSRIVLSPGPCGPTSTGVCLQLIEAMAGKVPLLGVCLGHQAIAHCFGGSVGHAVEPVHGKQSELAWTDSPLFEGIHSNTKVGRYHSLSVDKASLPDYLKITSESLDGEVMSIEHAELRHVYGIQFHPESILTPDGMNILKNFMRFGSES